MPSDGSGGEWEHLSRDPSPGVLLERVASLEPELASAGAARRLLRDVVSTAGQESWLDAGELAISEVVTNAVLHAHTPIDVRLVVRADRLCVEVRDRCPVPPVLKDYDDEATTGRGMGLVAAISLECGVTSLGAEGKVTWFSVGGSHDAAPEDLLAAWDLDESWPDEAEQPGLVTVELRSMPAMLWLSARQHHDALLRELVLYVAEHDAVVVDLARADEARFHISNALIHTLDAAEADGTARPAVPSHPSPLPWVPEELTLAISVPADSAGTFAALQDTLDAGEQLAKAGELLVRPALPEIVAVRDWACEQFIAQLGGSTPAPWPGTAQQRFETDVNDRDEPAALVWDRGQVLASDRGVVAADDANRILAVSEPLAALLGWEADALVGRRVVTLVPPALREAHVAGFTRHISTGDAHILGVPLELPALHADGSEVLCRFLIERDESGVGRPVYLAWIEPVAPSG